MTPERWQRLSELFDAALAREPQRRAEFLAEACAEDPALRHEVDSLLQAHARGEAVQMDPGFGVAHFWLGRAQDALGLHREAAASFEKYALLTARRGAAHAGCAWKRVGARW